MYPPKAYRKDFESVEVRNVIQFYSHLYPIAEADQRF